MVVQFVRKCTIAENVSGETNKKHIRLKKKEILLKNWVTYILGEHPKFVMVNSKFNIDKIPLQFLFKLLRMMNQSVVSQIDAALDKNPKVVS